jgi:hypothetical protein
MVHGDGVNELGQRVTVELPGARLDQADAELDVSEEAPLLGRPEGRRAAELERSADVVEQRGGDQEVAAKAWMYLRGLAADRRDRDGVLQ